MTVCCTYFVVFVTPDPSSFFFLLMGFGTLFETVGLSEYVVPTLWLIVAPTNFKSKTFRC